MFNDYGVHRHRRGPMFEKGALKYLMLDLVGIKPRHGYDIIRELEESSGGCYSPSPGTIYPTLQMLEDVGQWLAHRGKVSWGYQPGWRQDPVDGAFLPSRFWMIDRLHLSDQNCLRAPLPASGQ